MKSLRLAVVLLALALFATTLAQDTAKAPCSDPAYRQFDFWIGDWNVTAGGQQAGTNSITRELAGCALQERWEGAGGSRGTSINFYDATSGAWHQNWVDNSGNHLVLKGGYADGKMVLSGQNTRLGGKTFLDRITWHNQQDGTVRQVWDVSEDGGETWNTVFDGLYTRRD